MGLQVGVPSLPVVGIKVMLTFFSFFFLPAKRQVYQMFYSDFSPHSFWDFFFFLGKTNEVQFVRGFHNGKLEKVIIAGVCCQDTHTHTPKWTNNSSNIN